MPGFGRGSPNAKFFIVGEAWGEEEERLGAPFMGRSGEELGRILQDAGIMASDCYYSNLVNARPPRNDLTLWIPDKKKNITSDMVEVRGKWVKPLVKEGFESLKKELALVNPKMVIAVGNSALWALTGRSAITKWRGSLLTTDVAGLDPIPLVPTYHPAAVLRMREWRPIAVHDLARACREVASPTPRPNWNFILRPSLDQVLSLLGDLLRRAEGGEALTLDFDIETVGGHIRCFGFSWSRVDAICIPLMLLDTTDSYWTAEEEAEIIWQFYRLVTHPRVGVRGQNLLFDFQYVYRHWHFIPNLAQDSMITHHVLWAGMPKALAFQASMYCQWYVYWKEIYKAAEEKVGA